MTRRQLGWIALVSCIILGTFAPPVRTESPPPAQSPTWNEKLKSIARDIFENSTSKRELAFLEQVLGPVIAVAKDDHPQQWQLYARWMLADEKLADDAKIHLMSSSYVVYGTDDKQSDVSEPMCYLNKILPGDDPVVASSVRAPSTGGPPQIFLTDVVRVSEGENNAYYICRKKFEYKDGKWTQLSSSVNRETSLSR